MSDKRIFILAHDEARRRAVSAVAEAPAGYVVEIRPPTRNLEQNALLWTLLQDFADQLWWTLIVAGVPMQTKLESEEWKDILSAAFKQEAVRLAPGLNGGMVMLGMHTSKMGKREFADFIEFILATAADRGVEIHADEHEVTA